MDFLVNIYDRRYLFVVMMGWLAILSSPDAFACPSCGDVGQVKLLSQQVENALKTMTPPPADEMVLSQEQEESWKELFELDKLQSGLNLSYSLSDLDIECDRLRGLADPVLAFEQAERKSPFNIVFIAKEKEGGGNSSKESLDYLNRTDIEVNVFKNRLLTANGRAQIEGVLSEAGEMLDFQQKIKLVTSLGGAFGRNYDYDRIKEGHPNSEGIVTIEELVAGMQQQSYCQIWCLPS
jgi:hypothetical protein